jgi:hypothetical protein
LYIDSVVILLVNIVTAEGHCRGIPGGAEINKGVKNENIRCNEVQEQSRNDLGTSHENFEQRQEDDWNDKNGLHFQLAKYG